MTMVVQFPDLTEVYCSYYWHKEGQVKPGYIATPKPTTPFAFAVAAPHTGQVHLEGLLQEGFKSIRKMKNHWCSHVYEQNRILEFYWRKDPKGVEDKFPSRTSWAKTYAYAPLSQHVLAASGCGLKLGELPLKRKVWERFFTLMRLPLKISPLQRRWLELRGFTYLDESGLAQYWLNGWPSESYSEAVEMEHWKKVDPKGLLIEHSIKNQWGY